MQATIQKIKNELKNRYPPHEIQGIIRLMLNHLLKLTTAEMIQQTDRILDSATNSSIEEMIGRLKKSEPIQYIIGETEFYNLRINVNPSVLIPRQETEELVEWILKSVLPPDPSILDIGTGSGCIALALKHHLPGSDVFAVDISEKAIQTAVQNARSLRLDINFLKLDILSPPLLSQKFDLIVSNPPYVRLSEKSLMLPNVTNYEPPEALYVPDEDPLLFYRAVAGFSQVHLKEGGMIYFEMNEVFGSALVHLLEENGFSEIILKKDLNGKERMIRCRWNRP